MVFVFWQLPPMGSGVNSMCDSFSGHQLDMRKQHFWRANTEHDPNAFIIRIIARYFLSVEPHHFSEEMKNYAKL